MEKFEDGKMRIDKIRTQDNDDFKIEWEVEIIGNKFYAKKFINGKLRGKVKEVTREWMKERMGIELFI